MTAPYNSVLEVRGLCKSYPSFSLKDVSFSLRPGKITGFIGRNGAGKTTTLKALLDLVHPDGGEIRFFGNSGFGEAETRGMVGFVSGGADFYPRKKLSAITDAVRGFYPTWDETAYSRYMKLFDLDHGKTPSKLSQGMKIKYSLALALSHGAALLLLDEPTSGLDPISRDELSDIFLSLSQSGKTILFSTHITDDLDKCADDIIYIRNGRIAAESELQAFIDGYRTVLLDTAEAAGNEDILIGAKPAKHGISALIGRESFHLFPQAAPASLDDIMVHLEKQNSVPEADGIPGDAFKEVSEC